MKIYNKENYFSIGPNTIMKKLNLLLIIGGSIGVLSEVVSYLMFDRTFCHFS